MTEEVWDFANMKEGQGFHGEVVSVEKKPSDYGGEQYELQIKPLDHEIKGKTGCYHEWFSESDRRQSKFGEFIKALNSLGLKPKKDLSDLVGKKFMWEEVTFPWKVKDKESGEEKEVKCRLPTALGPEDGQPTKPKAAVPAGATAKPVATAGGIKLPPKVASTEPTNWSSLHTLLQNGAKKDQIARWAQRNGVAAETVNKHMEGLTEANKLTKDEDGNIFLVEEAQQ